MPPHSLSLLRRGEGASTVDARRKSATEIQFVRLLARCQSRVTPEAIASCEFPLQRGHLDESLNLLEELYAKLQEEGSVPQPVLDEYAQTYKLVLELLNPLTLTSSLKLSHHRGNLSATDRSNHDEAKFRLQQQHQSRLRRNLFGAGSIPSVGHTYAESSDDEGDLEDDAVDDMNDDETLPAAARPTIPRSNVRRRRSGKHNQASSFLNSNMR